MRTMTRSAGSIVPLVAATVVAAAPFARADEVNRTIDVSGEGKVFAAPDLATVAAGVATQAATAQEALAQNSQAMERVVAALKDRGVGPKDIQTSQFSVDPVYEQNRDRQETPKVVAYRVANQVTVKVRPVDEVGTTLDALIQAGGNRVSGIGFQVENPEKLLEEARAKAVQDARRRAETLAQAADVQLGHVLRIQETGAGFPQPRPYRGRMMELASAESVPIESGEQEFTVNVNVTFAIAGE